MTPLLAARSGALPDDAALIAEALGKLGNDESVTALDEMQRDFATQVRADATLALARQKNPNAANTLLLAVHDPDAAVVWRAIWAGEAEPMPRSCTAIAPFLENTDPAGASVRRARAGQAGVQAAGWCRHRRAAQGRRHPRVGECGPRPGRSQTDKNAVKPLGRHGHTLAGRTTPRRRGRGAGKDQRKRRQGRARAGLLDTSVMVRIQSVRALAAILGDKSEMFLRPDAPVTASAWCARKPFAATVWPI